MKNRFREKYNNLSEADKVLLRDKVIDMCGWNYSTFYNKMRNPGSITVLEKKPLARVLQIPLSEL